MYISMLSCYLVMIINFINFTISGAMVFFDIQFFGANHAQFSLLAILVFVLSETIVMYFFIATGKSIKNILIENNSSESERLWDKIKSIKGIIFPQNNVDDYHCRDIVCILFWLCHFKLKC